MRVIRARRRHSPRTGEGGTGRGQTGSGRGFIDLELLVLLVVMLAFLSGIVLLLNDAVSSGEGVAGRAVLGAEAERVLDFVDTVVSDAKAVGTGGDWGKAPAAVDGSVLEMLVDIDGDAQTGSYSAGGISGLERVLVYRRFPGDKRLLALVFAKQPDEAAAEGEIEPRRSIITDELDARDPGAFELEFVRGPRGAPQSLKVSLALSDGSESLSASRTVHYTGLPPG